MDTVRPMLQEYGVALAKKLGIKHQVNNMPPDDEVHHVYLAFVANLRRVEISVFVAPKPEILDVDLRCYRYRGIRADPAGAEGIFSASEQFPVTDFDSKAFRVWLDSKLEACEDKLLPLLN